MNRNVFYHKPYEKPNHFSNASNRNNNYHNNHSKNGFQANNNNFLYMKNNRNSYHSQKHHSHQGNVNRNNNNSSDTTSRLTQRERERSDEEIDKCWNKRKRNNNRHWKEKPAATADPSGSKEDTMPPKWTREDAVKAIEMENAFNQSQSNQYVLRFPDPFIDKSIIQAYSSAIVDVRVQQPITPRFVYVQLQPETDAEKLKQDLAKIQFGNGFLKLEKRNVPQNEHLKPEDIDPFTIFMGNIHPSTSIQSVKQSVEKAYRVDVGFAKKHKFGRYAFAKFRSAADARNAFSTLRNAVGRGGMDLVVRFRRLRGNIMTGHDRNLPRKVTGNEKKVDGATDDAPKVEISETPMTETKAGNPATSSIEYIASLTNDIFDWDNIPMFNISPSNNNNSPLLFTSSSASNDLLDDLLNQFYSDVSSVLTDESDLY
ncbi:3-phosphoinositide-dependent protein kinase B [Culicoides brevitarsis]|uniref:3-phosphoinositide-dependent protein kinase B n=1 Tax=Culicoides brevitarsis TaxID=469753 RepID=UPI00307C4A18